jgi:phage terminase small subunit
MANKALTPIQKAFCEAYAKSGNGMQAAIDVGYSEQYARKRLKSILESPAVTEYLKELNGVMEAKNISSIEEIQQFWTNMYLGKIDDGDYPAKLSDRIRASELLMKAKGGFLEKMELTGAGGKDLLPTINLNFVKSE